MLDGTRALPKSFGINGSGLKSRPHECEGIHNPFQASSQEKWCVIRNEVQEINQSRFSARKESTGACVADYRSDTVGVRTRLTTTRR